MEGYLRLYCVNIYALLFLVGKYHKRYFEVIRVCLPCNSLLTPYSPLPAPYEHSMRTR